MTIHAPMMGKCSMEISGPPLGALLLSRMHLEVYRDVLIVVSGRRRDLLASHNDQRPGMLLSIFWSKEEPPEQTLIQYKMSAVLRLIDCGINRVIVKADFHFYLSFLSLSPLNPQMTLDIGTFEGIAPSGLGKEHSINFSEG